MTKEKDLPYITKLHPVYGIKLYSIDGTTWSTNPAELAVIQERLEKGLVGSIDKRMIPPRRKAGPRPAGEEVVELEPENEDEEGGEEGLELEEEVDDEDTPSPRVAGGSRDKRIGDALRLIGDELGSDGEDLADDREIAGGSAKAAGPTKSKKGGSAPLKAPRATAPKPGRTVSGVESLKKGKSGSAVEAAKKMAKPPLVGEMVKAQPLAASGKQLKTGDSPKQSSSKTITNAPQKGERTAPQKAKKAPALKAPAPQATAKAKKAAAPSNKTVSLGKKVAQGSSKRGASTKAPAMGSSKGSTSPAKSKASPKSAADKKQSVRKGVTKKAR